MELHEKVKFNGFEIDCEVDTLKEISLKKLV